MSDVSPDLTSPPAIPPDAPVSFVIPARGNGALLDACLELVVRQLDGDDEVIVAAGDGPAATVAEDWAARDGRVRVVMNEQGITPAGLNLAVSAARHPVIIRVDAQSRIPEGYRDRLVSILARTGAANAGGRQVALPGPGVAAAIAAAMNARLGNGGAAYRTGAREGPVDTVYLGAFRADVLSVLGGFDERFVTNQDAELNERIRRAGGVVWLDPTLVVGYLPRTSMLALARQFRGYGRGRALTARRHPGSLGPRQMAAPLLLVSMLVAVLASPVTVAPLLLLGGGYFAALSLGVLLEGKDARRRSPATVLALAVMHLAWGYGFLSGLWPSRSLRGRG